MSLHDELEKEIIAIFSEGLYADHDVIEFVERSYGSIPDSEFFEKAFESESWESEAVLDLIFFPDFLMRKRIEGLIPDGFGSCDEERLISALCSEPHFCELRFPFSDQPLNIRVPERMMERFIRRLNLKKEIPGELKTLVKDSFSGSESEALALIREKALKNSSFLLLQDFLENLSTIFSPQIEDINTVITISGMFPDETSIYVAISMAHEKWDHTLKKYEDTQRALSSGCIEELMSKGMRVQAINKDDIEQKMNSAGRVLGLLRFRDC